MPENPKFTTNLIIMMYGRVICSPYKRLRLIGVKMETTNKKQALLKAIYGRLEQVYEGNLEDVLELLNICESEDAVSELEDAKVNGTISWEQYKQELKSCHLEK